MEIKGILVSLIAPMENHIANGGEKLLGNASSIKRTPEGRVYISGQMQRHVLFSAIDRLNLAENAPDGTFVSNADGVTNQIEKDLRADMGGFMMPSRGDYSGRRTAPLSATMAVSINKEKSQIGRDLLVRVQNYYRSSDPNEKAYSFGYIADGGGNENPKEQALATKEFSEFDLMLMHFHLDISALSISKAFRYTASKHVETKYFKHAKEDERKRRAKLFLEATRSMHDYANQARNAVSGEPQQVLIVFDTKLSRKACRYFTANETEQKNILAELKDREAFFRLGNDQEGDTSVLKAFQDALSELENSTLFDPSEKDKQGNEKIINFANFAGMD